MARVITSGPAAPAGSAPADAIAAQDVLRVRATRPSRRRAGREFGPEPTDIPLDALSETEIAALREDPALVVEGPLTL